MTKLKISFCFKTRHFHCSFLNFVNWELPSKCIPWKFMTRSKSGLLSRHRQYKQLDFKVIFSNLSVMASIKNPLKVNKTTSWNMPLSRVTSTVKPHMENYFVILPDFISQFFSMNKEYRNNVFYFFMSSFFVSLFSFVASENGSNSSKSRPRRTTMSSPVYQAQLTYPYSYEPNKL